MKIHECTEIFNNNNINNKSTCFSSKHVFDTEIAQSISQWINEN